MSSPPAPPQTSQARNFGWVVAQFGTIAVLLVIGRVWGAHWEREGSVQAGRALLIFSGLIALGGFLSLGRNLTANPQPRANAVLVQHGIYRFMRHPLYSSLILVGFGWSLLWQSGPALVAALVLVMVLHGKARTEERFLRERFPGYAEYSKRVRRFIPGIY